jgi:hypothetical protein
LKEILFVPTVSGLTQTITDGIICHTDSGKLKTHIETLSPFEQIQKLNEKWGLDKMELLSENNILSTTPETPTVFSALTNHMIPKGEKAFDFTTGQEILWPMNTQIETYTMACGYLNDKVLKGKFNATIIYQEMNRKIDLIGRFEAFLN